MSQVCPECGIEGVCLDSGSIVVLDGPRKGVHFFGGYECLVRQVADLKAERDRYTAALTPSIYTKRSYMGEFELVPGVRSGDFVPWTTIKDIMKAIREAAQKGQG